MILRFGYLKATIETINANSEASNGLDLFCSPVWANLFEIIVLKGVKKAI